MKLRFLFIAFLVASSTFVFAQKLNRVVHEQSEIIARITTTPCPGGCPVYEATLFSDGVATYHGRANTERMGFYQTQVDLSVFNQLLTAVNKASFFQLNDSYPTNEANYVQEKSNTVTYIKQGNKEKTVVQNSGGPERLSMLQQELISLFEDQVWIPVGGQ